MDTNSEPIQFDNRDIARYTPGERRMAMRGFEAQYPDIVDYIVRITHKIWEEKSVGYIYDTYQHNCVLHFSGGDVHGREAVVMGTIQSLAAFPDDRTYADDVIWSGNENDGFHTSHLITGMGHNTGWSRYGPPTGRKVVWRTMANCLSRDNLIFEEWLLRDETSVIRQMGLEVNAVVEQQVHDFLNRGGAYEPVGEVGRVVGQHVPARYTPRTPHAPDIEDFLHDTFNEIWNRRMFNLIPERYSRTYVGAAVGGRTLHGPAELTTHMLELYGMFPDAGVTLNHVYWNGNDADGYRVAARWTFTGTHTGYGPYGSPSGARVRCMGLSHHHVQNNVITKEITFLDDMEILRRIAAKRLGA